LTDVTVEAVHYLIVFRVGLPPDLQSMPGARTSCPHSVRSTLKAILTAGIQRTATQNSFALRAQADRMSALR
jgi:hypothetical protein